MTGEPVEDEATKAILVRRDFVFGYTGFAALPSSSYLTKTDWWLLAQLVGKPTMGTAIKNIAQEAADAIARIRVSSRRKHHTFVGAGFAPTRPGATRRPSLMLISDALAPDLTSLPAATRHLDTRLYWLPETAPFVLHIDGQPLTDDERRRVERQIRRVLPLGAVPVARVIAATVEDVARRNRLVGDRLLVGIVPRAAGETTGAGMSMPLSGLGAPETSAEDDPHATRFYYVPGATSDDFLVYGPHWTDGNMMIAAPVMATGSSAALPPPQPGPPDRWDPP